MLEHGGRLAAAIREFGIPREEWIDLSTGIHPVGYPVPPVPAECWQRLPEEEDGLLENAALYYGTSHLLPCAGSQAAIMVLPSLRPPCRVGVLGPTYAEHAQAWQRAGHHVVNIEEYQPDMPFDVVVLVNPNNPTGRLFTTNTLLEWHAALSPRGGWLVVDEAFMDVTPGHSLAPYTGMPSLIVLRSLGKFFGLAGIRVGFILAWKNLLVQLREVWGPWPLAHPARWVAKQVLVDTEWQAEQRSWLLKQSQRLAELLAVHNMAPAGGTGLFQWVRTSDAGTLFAQLAPRGVLVRRFDHPASLRFGLPADERSWAKVNFLLQER
ncbi:MAG TPA: threonine-phosphate decarboxylase CobD [Methylophilaceae bacterium]|nr:threonine-phosphate decarboxylase CobD [Methylophilaceae bacterium]